jgi:hypothetical protein
MAESSLHCTVHFDELEESTLNDAVSVLSDAKWQTLQASAAQWIHYDGTERCLVEKLLALLEVERPTQVAAHTKCYSR